MPEDVNPYNAGSPAAPSAPAADRAYPLEVSFELLRDDYVAAHVGSDRFRQVVRLRRLAGNVGIAIGVGILVMEIAGVMTRRVREYDIISALSSGLILATGTWLRCGAARGTRRQLAAFAKKAFPDPRNRCLGGWRRLSLGPAGILESAEHFETLWRWTAVERIEDVEEFLLFDLGAVQVLPAPKRAFQDEAHLQSFFDAARRFHLAALGGDSETPFDRTP